MKSSTPAEIFIALLRLLLEKLYYLFHCNNMKYSTYTHSADVEL